MIIGADRRSAKRRGQLFTSITAVLKEKRFFQQ